MKDGKASEKHCNPKRSGKLFDRLMDMCRNNAMASGAAYNPVIFEPMVISIALSQTKKIYELEFKLNEVLWQRVCAQEKGKETESKQ